MTQCNRLSVRSDYADQPMGEEVTVDGSAVELYAPRLIILIHGFQNSESKAHQSYSKFRAALRSALWLHDEQLLGTFWEFHWPGDHPNVAMSVVTYSARVPDARESGRLLAEFLSELNPDQEVFLASHSLGCRVALDAVRTIRKKGAQYAGATVRGLFLMAAAVPVSYCMPTRLFDRALPDSVEYAFYSRRDRALSRTFAPGQYLYGESGTAVGSHGEPPERWANHSETETNLRHKDYWGSFVVAEQIGGYMGYIRDRRLPDHSILSHVIEEDVKLISNTLEDWSISSR
jgi:Alpha/beta hydrolase of unknown function (DUF900)